MKTRKTFKSQAGMTLTESLLVLGVGALVAVLAYGGYKMATSDVKSQSQVNGTVQLVGKIKQLYSTAANYGATGAALTTAVINAQIVPSDFKTSATAISNAWGGGVTVAVNGTSQNQFDMTITGVPAENCVDLLAGISNAALRLQVGKSGTMVDVKTATTAFNPTTAATTCGGGAAAYDGTIILTAQ